MDLNNLNIDFHIDATTKYNPPNQIMRDFRINALHASTEGETLTDYGFDLTEHGKALFQEYLTSSIVGLTLGVPEHTYCKWSSPEPVSRRKRPRNTRIQMVQAKRKALDLDIDGRYCGIRTRRDSLRYRQATEDWIVGRRSDVPHIAEYEYKPARVRRKEKRRTLKWKPLELSPYEKWWINAQEEERAKVEQTFEEIAWATDVSVSTAKGAFISVFNAYGKEEAGK